MKPGRKVALTMGVAYVVLVGLGTEHALAVRQRMVISDTIPAGAHVIDVRDAVFYQAGHIPGSDSIPLDVVEDYCGTLDDGRPIVTYCESSECGDAQTAAEKLSLCTASRIYVYLPGYGGWLERGRHD